MNQAQSFMFFDDTSTSAMSNELKNAGRGEELELQVSAISGGSFELTIQGQTDVKGNDWFQMAAISKENYDVCETITASGGYAVAVAGVNKIRISNTGTPGGVRVFGIIVC